MFIVMCMMTKRIINGFSEVKMKKGQLLTTVMYAVMLVLVINGTSYQIQRLERKTNNEDYTVPTELYTYGTLEYFANRKLTPLTDEEREKVLRTAHPEGRFYGGMTVDLVYNYYTYDLDDNLFYKYLARRRE